MSKRECEERAKELALKILPAAGPATVLDVKYAITQLTALYEMVEEGFDPPTDVADAIAAEREACANIALAIDSGRGNEKEIARAIRDRTLLAEKQTETK